MTAKRRIIAITGMYALFFQMLATLWGETIDVRQVEFKGLKYLSAREIMEQVRFANNNGIMRIDVNSLKEVLTKNPMVRDSSIALFGEKLIVTVSEREPAHVCAVVRGSETIPFELDDAYAIVSVRIIHRTDIPLVIFMDEDMPGGRLSGKAMEFLKNLSFLNKIHPEVYREVSVVKLRGDGLFETRLKGRRTKIIMQDFSFTTLKYIVSMLDEKKYYPSTLWVGSGFGVIK